MYSSEANMLIYSNSLDLENTFIFCQILKESCIKCLLTSCITTLSSEILHYASLRICKCELCLLDHILFEQYLEFNVLILYTKFTNKQKWFSVSTVKIIKFMAIPSLYITILPGHKLKSSALQLLNFKRSWPW